MVKLSQHKRKNPSTGKTEYFFPMEITGEPEDRMAMKEAAKQSGLDIAMSCLGNRTFLAVMIPCKDHIVDKTGRDVYVDTPEERQREIYHEYMRAELAEQDKVKQNSRCNIPNGKGKIKRCQFEIPNPNYVHGGSEPSKIKVKNCDECPYSDYRHSKNTVLFSELSMLDDDGREVDFEPVSPASFGEADRYLHFGSEFIDFVRNNPKTAYLTEVAELLVREYSCAQSAKVIDRGYTTAKSQAKVLGKLLEEFIENCMY